MDAIVDTTVIVHLLRRYKPALAWFKADLICGVTSTTWMEVMAGATSKASQAHSREMLVQFDLLYPTADDQRWAMAQLERFQFSHHIGKEDCLIASVAHRLQVPLYTHNLKNMQLLLGGLALQPYP